MSRRAPPPLRFLALVLCGWIAIRAATWTGWPEQAARKEMPAPAQVIASTDERPAPPTALTGRAPGPAPLHPFRGRSRSGIAGPGRGLATAEGPPVPPAAIVGAPVDAPSVFPPIAPAFARTETAAFPPPLPASRRRWSASAWLLGRREGAPTALAPAGLLGGSQAGGRLLYRVNGDAARPLAIAGRVSAPLRGAGAEAALGIDWRPLARLPVHLLVERRQDLDGNGRSAFAATLYGGASARLPAGARLDAYAQAGAVGLAARDLFADGAVRIAVPTGPVEIGGGVWAAAQPGIARLDAGPQVSLPLHARNVRLRLSADWRFRLAGDAAPGSGPALTLATDF